LLTLTAVIWTETSTFVQAGLITYDGFNYKPGVALNGQSGGGDIGWSAAWNGANVTVAKGSLSDPTGTLLTSGQSVLTSGTALSSAGRSLAKALGGDDQSIYVSFLLDPINAGKPSYSLLTLNPGTENGLQIGKTPNDNRYGLFYYPALGPGSQAFSTTAFANNTTVFLAVKIQFLANTDMFSLFVNPTPGGPEPAKADATLNAPIGALNFVNISSDSGSKWKFDEIRIGDTFASVTPVKPVPEPSSWVLLGIGVLAVFRDRVKRTWLTNAIT
jgi:hypothetical protein